MSKSRKTQKSITLPQKYGYASKLTMKLRYNSDKYPRLCRRPYVLQKKSSIQPQLKALLLYILSYFHEKVNTFDKNKANTA